MDDRRERRAVFPAALAVTTLWTIRRETGSAKWTLLAALLPTALGMALCAAFTALTRLIGW